MVDMGLYKSGANPTLDEALQRMPALQSFLRQALDEQSSTDDTARGLAAALGERG
jgi:flagellar biosynthesis/type III secretory pathway ATPase